MKHESYHAILTMVYVGLIANVLLVVGCAPLVALMFTSDPVGTWPLYVVALPLCAPGLVGVFAVLARHAQVARVLDPLRVFGRAVAGAWRRALAIGALASLALVVLGVDIAWAWGRAIGAVAIPVLAMLGVGVVVVALLSLVVLVERPRVKLRDVAKASLYLALRRWYLTLLSLLVLVLLVQITALKPAIGLGLVAAPLLYVVWANSRFTLKAALDAQSA